MKTRATRQSSLRGRSVIPGLLRPPLPASHPPRRRPAGLPVLPRRTAVPGRLQPISPRRQRLHELPRGDHEHRKTSRRQGKTGPGRLRELPPGHREGVPEELPLHPGGFPLHRLPSRHPRPQKGQSKNIKLAIIEKCTECHGNDDYTASGHSEAVLKGNQDAAACSDCHGLHDTRVYHTSLRSTRPRRASSTRRSASAATATAP